MNYLADSCFWMALYNPKDANHKKALDRYETIYQNAADRFLIPFPSLYETINTKFAKNKADNVKFEELLKSSKAVLIHDDEYKNTAFDLSFKHNTIGKRPLSMVDIIIRLIIEDSTVRIDALLSYNERDFHDVCANRNVELVSY